MRSWKPVKLLAIPIGLSLSLLCGGTARADVAADGGSVARDMATMAKPDMTTAGNTDDGGCSIAGHRATSSGAALSLLGAGMVAYLVARRRQQA